MLKLPYLILAFTLAVLYFIEIGKLRFGNLSAKSARRIAYILIWVFAGLRGHVMSDFISYYPYYNNYPDIFHLSAINFLNNFEPGFNIYTSIIKTFTDNYFAWVAINTLIDFSVLAWFFHRYCRSMILPLIFFIAFNGFLMEFNLYRNMKAIDLFLLSIPYLQKRKLLPYFALNLIGVTFHSSSLLYLPLYFVLNLRISKYIVWGGFIFANVVFFLNVGVIGTVINNIPFIQSLDAYDKLTRHGESGSEFGFSVGYFERTISFLLFAYYIWRNPKEYELKKVFFNCYWIYYISFLFFYEVSVFVERIPTLFIFSYWVLYPAVVDIKSKDRQIVNLGISVLVVLKIFTSFSSPACKYENILFTNPNYEKRESIYLNSQID